MPLRNALLQGIHFLEEVLMFSYMATGIVKTNKNLADQLPELTKKWLDVLIAFLGNKVVYSTHFLP